MTQEAARWMWFEACKALEQVERLHQATFTPSPGFVWQPPVDVLELQATLIIEVALPGVAPDDIEVVLQNGDLLIGGERPARTADPGASIKRLELPYGRFERVIPLPRGRYEIERREYANGCLLVTMRKM
jgi:HSP20 family molecular chaperone IbpA